MSADSIRFRISSGVGVPLDEVEVSPPGVGRRGERVPGMIRVGGRRWEVTAAMFEQDEELVNRVVIACRQSASTVG
jgi:hypothetical protein